MTIHHIILIKVKPVEVVAAFKENILGVLKASAGKNFTDRGKGYEYALIVEFSNKEDLVIYIDHKLHVNFKAMHMVLIVDEALAFDYEV
ncbi:hypothetical protein BC938DRAFT_478007 [Jimgerdemannia flammicorona]|uniref:Stress-response A/B barrel domain-containing protein n=1 Tax=Jimgerdemannia flammicorona TaxID=994334 RepID=A0A433P6V2_9FUNG|nr:hypothetical protein BC938DRAFT_478007 [Jimgerdemannia flammicorona]